MILKGNGISSSMQKWRFTPAPVVTPAPNVPSNTNIVSNSTLAANLGVVSQTVKNGYVLFTVTNRNSQMVSYYTINYQLKDSAGNVLETGSVWGHAINAGSIQYQADYVTREKAALVDIAKSTISITVDQTLSYKDMTSAVKVTKGTSADGSSIPITFVNNGTSYVGARGVIFFYNAAKQVIAVDTISASLYAGETKYDDVYVPYDYETEDYSRIKYASTEIFYYAYE